jgi:hypothetical protein
MADIQLDTIVKVKSGTLWRGVDIGNKIGLVLDNFSYLLVEIDGIDEPVKLLRTEIEPPQQIEDDDEISNMLNEFFGP